MQDLPQKPPQHFHYFTQIPQTLIASIIKFPPQTKNDTYKDLVCSAEDKATISELITTLADNNKLNLLLKQSYIKNLGAQVNHVHPLKFLSTIFQDPKLKLCMEDIFDDYFKKNGFMDGLAPSLARESEKGKVAPFLPEFANEIGISLESMEKYFREKDWESLVHFLIWP